MREQMVGVMGTSIQHQALVLACMALCVLNAWSARAETNIADRLEEAKVAYGLLDYDSCVDNAAQSLRMEGTREDRVAAYRYLGLCHAALGDTEVALEQFIRLLAIEPEARLPDGLSPRFTSTFLEAKGYWLGREAMKIEIMDESQDGALRLIQIAIDDRKGLIDKIAWRAENGDTGPMIKAAEKMEIEVPGEIAQKLIGFDEHGGEVFSLVIMKEAPPAQQENAEMAESEAEPEGSMLTSPFLWAGIGGVGAFTLVGVGVGVGLGIYFYEPSTVTLSSNVSINDGSD